MAISERCFDWVILRVLDGAIITVNYRTGIQVARITYQYRTGINSTQVCGEFRSTRTFIGFWICSGLRLDMTYVQLPTSLARTT
jgi:hypothetical protein